MTELEQLEKIQTQLGKLQYTYRDNRPEFWATLLAWETVRLAWYVVSGDLDTARAKLGLVQNALSIFENHLARHSSTAFESRDATQDETR